MLDILLGTVCFTAIRRVNTIIAGFKARAILLLISKCLLFASHCSHPI